MLPNPQLNADLVTFTEELLNGKLHFLCSEFESLHFGNVVTAKVNFIFVDFSFSVSNRAEHL